MKFRRKSAEAAEAEAGGTADDAGAAGGDARGDAGSADRPTGPFDIDEVPTGDTFDRLDLGSLLIAPSEDLELRLQVEEQTEKVQAVVLAGPDGAVELRAFAAPRGGDLWSEVRPRIAADFAQRGGTATERQGRFGTELVGELTVRAQDGRTGTQVSRIVGINGPRWMLRATFLGRPAHEVEAAGPWEQAMERVVVRRGTHAMPVGDELPLTLPSNGQLLEQPDA